MRVLLVDPGGFMLDFALRCQAEGHEVRWFIRRTPRTKDIGIGLLDPPSKIVPDWQSWMRWSDIVILGDNTKYLVELDHWRRRGEALIVGPTPEAAAWELERGAGMKIMKRCGVEVPPWREFSDYDSAISYVKREGRAFVSKPCGDEPDKSLSYVAKSPADLIYMLERWKRAKRHKGNFILQERVKGVEMAVGGWFGPSGFISGWHENFEFKKLMAGDTGPATGEMGSVFHIVSQSKLADKVLKPFEEELHKLGYVGYVDVNCIIDESGTPWPLEFTMRPGWPSFNIQTALLKGDPVEWLADLSAGRDSRPFRHELPAVGIVMVIPDFPFSLFTRKDVTGIPIYRQKGGIIAQRGIHPCELRAGEAPHDIEGKVVRMPCLVTAGDYLLVASGVGTSVRQAKARATRVLESIEVPNSPFWRPDIGDRLKQQLPTIQAQGYSTKLSY